MIAEGTLCKCFYCGRDQVVPAPPSLVECQICGKLFRVIEGDQGQLELIWATQPEKRDLTGEAV